MSTSTPLETLRKRLTGLDLDDGFTTAINFKPRPTDVIISTASKCGTTWVQQICHGLRSNGDMSFGEISLAIPCMEMALAYGYTDLQAEQTHSPRMYKTHLWYHSCPKGAGKYIFVTRNPEDAAVSFYYMMENWLLVEGEVSMEDVVDLFVLRRGIPEGVKDNASVLHHLMSWYPHRKDENVLWLHYEDLIADLPKCVRLISDFLEIGVGDEDLLKKVTYQASFGFMKKNGHKFDEHPLKLARNEAIGLDKHAGLQNNEGKVRKGVSSEGREELSASMLERIDQRWKEVVTSKTGYESYQVLREGVNKELGREFS